MNHRKLAWQSSGVHTFTNSARKFMIAANEMIRKNNFGAY